MAGSTFLRCGRGALFFLATDLSFFAAEFVSATSRGAKRHTHQQTTLLMPGRVPEISLRASAGPIWPVTLSRPFRRIQSTV